jgi:hypothetical protein
MVTVEFRKKNGELRRLNGRLGVRKGLVDPGNPQRPSTARYPEYLTIFDVGIRDYRTVNLDTITYIAANGCRFIVMEV